MVDIKTIKYLKNGEDIQAIDWSAGVLLPVDKPFEWTSFDVVNKLRFQLKRITHKKKFKVGHAGTLDPRATGLLLIACGKATKSIESLTTEDKRYRGIIQLGATTPTYDGEMEADALFPVSHITDEMIDQAREHFFGWIDQFPPIYSAIKKDGKRLYQYARKGQAVDIPSRTIEIKSLTFNRLTENTIEFSCHCSKGTYIRSLAHDVGKYLNSGGYLKTLERTSIGSYLIDDAWSLEHLVEVLMLQTEQ